MNWRQPERRWFVYAALGMLAALGGVVFEGGQQAIADRTRSHDPGQSGAASPILQRPGHAPFTLWADGPDAIAFDSLSPSEQEGVMAQAERSESSAGYEVAQKWSGYSRDMAATAAIENARRLTGLSGTDDMGVAP